jgi:hypothetical protein
VEKVSPGELSIDPGADEQLALVKALARAQRWKRLLEEGRYPSINELARAEKIDRGGSVAEFEAGFCSGMIGLGWTGMRRRNGSGRLVQGSAVHR